MLRGQRRTVLPGSCVLVCQVRGSVISPRGLLLKCQDRCDQKSLCFLLLLQLLRYHQPHRSQAEAGEGRRGRVRFRAHHSVAAGLPRGRLGRGSRGGNESAAGASGACAPSVCMFLRACVRSSIQSSGGGCPLCARRCAGPGGTVGCLEPGGQRQAAAVGWEEQWVLRGAKGEEKAGGRGVL